MAEFDQYDNGGSGNGFVMGLIAGRLLARMFFDPPRPLVPLAEGVQTGTDGDFSWERRVATVGTPDALHPTAGPRPRLLSLTVTVRWSRSAAVTLATLRMAPDT